MSEGRQQERYILVELCYVHARLHMFSIYTNDPIGNKGVMQTREIRQLEKKTEKQKRLHLYLNKNALSRSQYIFLRNSDYNVILTLPG